MEAGEAGTVVGSLEIRTDLTTVVEVVEGAFVEVLASLGIHASRDVAGVTGTDVACLRGEVLTRMVATPIFYVRAVELIVTPKLVAQVS